MKRAIWNQVGEPWPPAQLGCDHNRLNAPENHAREQAIETQ